MPYCNSKIPSLLFLLILIACSEGSDSPLPEEEPEVDRFNLIITAKREYVQKQNLDDPFFGYEDKTCELEERRDYGRNWLALDTLVIDFNQEFPSVITPFIVCDKPYRAWERIRYIKVINSPQASINFSDDWNFDSCLESSSAVECELNGLYYRKSDDVMLYDNANVSEEVLNSFFDMSNHSNVRPFVKSSSAEELVRIELSEQEAQISYPNLTTGSILSIQTSEFTDQNAESVNAMAQVRVQDIVTAKIN
ncbi:MAG: hypothetical protein ACPGAO_04595 [Flavobacteriaceae bacterium]